MDRIKEEIPFIPLKTMINWKGKGDGDSNVSFEFSTAIAPNGLSQNKKAKSQAATLAILLLSFTSLTTGAESVETFHVLVDRPSISRQYFINVRFMVSRWIIMFQSGNSSGKVSWRNGVNHVHGTLR